LRLEIANPDGLRESRPPKRDVVCVWCQRAVGLVDGLSGVKTIVDHLRGKHVDPRIDTGVMVVTPANLDSPEVKDLVNPSIARCLQAG